jgi:hypothetical protein
MVRPSLARGAGPLSVAPETQIPDTEIAPTERPLSAPSAPNAPTLIDAIPTAPRARKRRLWPAMLALVIALLGAGGAAVYFFAPELIALAFRFPAAPNAPRRIHTRTANPAFKTLENPAVLQAVLADEGWTVNVVPGTKNAAGTSVIAQVQKDDKTGAILFQHYPDEVAAGALDGAMKAADGEFQCKRVGVLVLCVDIDHDRRASKELLAAITR